MKPFVFLILTGITALISCHTAVREDAGLPVKYTGNLLNISRFDTIEISSYFETELRKSDRYSVTVQYPEEIRDLPVAECTAGTLKLGINGAADSVKALFHGKDLKQFLSQNRPKALILAPKFDKIKLDGFSEVILSGDFQTGECQIETSGSSHISGGSINTKILNIRMAGASTCETGLNADSAAVLISGSADFRPSLSAESLTVTQSGSSSVLLGEQYYSEGRIFTLNISGKSTLDAGKVPFHEINVTAADTSCAVVHPAKILEANASGTAVIRYIFTKGLAKTITETEEGSVRIE